MTINWKELFSLVAEKAIALFLLLLVYLVVDRIVFRFLKKFYSRYRLTKQLSEQRAVTLYKLFMSFMHYILYFFTGYYALSILGFPMATLIAGAGIAGLAIGLGAQGFINDLVNGIFILLERQFEVGDHIIISQMEGIVKSIGLRITTLSGVDGAIHYIRNKDISTVSNLSAGKRRVFINIFLKNTVSLQQVEAIMKEITPPLWQQLPMLETEPVLLGLQTNVNGHLFYSVVLYTNVADTAHIQHTCYTYYLTQLNQKGIATLDNTIYP